MRTDSTAWATQLRMMAPQLVALLNEHLGDGTITRVAIVGPDAPVLEEGPPLRSGTAAARATPTADPRIALSAARC